MKTAVEKLLRKSRLFEAYDGLSNEALKKQILEEYARLLGENDLPDKMLRRHQTGSIYPSVAIHRVLQQNGYTKTESLGLIRKSVLDSAKSMADLFQKAGKLPFFFVLLRLMCPASMKSGFGAAGWDMRWKVNSRSEIRWDCHSCYYHNEFLRYDMPELTAIFCESDDVVYGDIPGVKWGRTKTIGRGAELCDFCFYHARRIQQ